MDTQGVLDVFEDLVQATASEDEAQLPQDLDTTNDIITGTLDLLFSDLENSKTIESSPSVTTDEVNLASSNYGLVNNIWGWICIKVNWIFFTWYVHY